MQGTAEFNRVIEQHLQSVAAQDAKFAKKPAKKKKAEDQPQVMTLDLFGDGTED